MFTVSLDTEEVSIKKIFTKSGVCQNIGFIA